MAEPNMHFVCTHDEARAFIEARSEFWLGTCGCREPRGTCARSRHDVCLSFAAGDSSSQGPQRRIALQEALSVLALARTAPLIARPWRATTPDGVGGLCFCCDDCCGYFHNDPRPDFDFGAFVERTDRSACTDCMACVPACWFGARVDSEGVLEVSGCAGCGLCIPACPLDAIEMVPRG